MQINELVVSYAQNREDIILAGFFAEDYKGFYVDIGAHDPKIDSVTKYFYERGWTGINVDPNPEMIKRLRTERPLDLNIGVGIGDSRGELNLRVYKNGDGLSTLSDEMKQNYTAHKSGLTSDYEDMKVKIITLKELFETYNVKKIDFLKIDIEGFEYNALISNDWSKYRPKVLCIESNHIVKNWRPILVENGYTKIFSDGLNDYYSDTLAKSIKAFSYVDAVIGRKIVSAHIESLLREQEKNIEVLSRRLDDSENHLKEAQRQAEILYAHILSQKPIRRQVKTLLRSLDNSLRIRIDDLNVAKRKHVSRLIPISLNHSKEYSRDVLLSIVKKNDLDNFYSNGHKRGYKKNYAYKISSFSYGTSRKIAKKTFHVIRNTRNRVRSNK